MRGRFLAFEGGDGSGKSTQLAQLVAALRAGRLEVVETREPGGTALGRELRRLLLDEGDMDPRAEALLMAADRAQHVSAVIRPALDRGAWVVCDRYVPSSLVYQGVVRGLGVDAIAALSTFATDGLAPDLVVVLDIDDATASARRSPVADRMEREGEDFHRAVRSAYRDLADRFGWSVVDATGTAEDVARRVWARVEPLLGT